MTKVILIGSDKRSYAVVKKVVGELDFLYNDDLELKHYGNFSDDLKTEILCNDCKKIYIINANLIKYSLAKFIRENDWHSEIILLKGENALLEKEWQNIHNIFSIIDEKDLYNSVLKDNLNLIFKHCCQPNSFRFKNRDINLSIYFENILYIYRDTGERKVVIVTDNNIYTLNMGLKDTIFRLDKRFKQVHRACVVNTMRAEKFDWSKNSFILDTGDEVNLLSKNYRENISDTIDI